MVQDGTETSSRSYSLILSLIRWYSENAYGGIHLFEAIGLIYDEWILYRYLLAYIVKRFWLFFKYHALNLIGSAIVNSIFLISRLGFFTSVFWSNNR